MEAILRRDSRASNFPSSQAVGDRRALPNEVGRLEVNLKHALDEAEALRENVARLREEADSYRADRDHFRDEAEARGRESAMLTESAFNAYSTLESLRAEVKTLAYRVRHIEDRERHFVKVLGIPDGGDARHDWDARLTQAIEAQAAARNAQMALSLAGFGGDLLAQVGAALDAVGHARDAKAAADAHAQALRARVRELETRTVELCPECVNSGATGGINEPLDDCPACGGSGAVMVPP